MSPVDVLVLVFLFNAVLGEKEECTDQNDYKPLCIQDICWNYNNNNINISNITLKKLKLNVSYLY